MMILAEAQKRASEQGAELFVIAREAKPLSRSHRVVIRKAREK